MSPIGIKSFKKFLQPNGAAAQPKRAAETIKGSGTSKRLLAPANGATILTREQTKEREQALTRVDKGAATNLERGCIGECKSQSVLAGHG